MKRLAIGLTAALAAFASFAEPQATRTYVNAKIAIAKGEAANDAEAKANAAKTAAVAEAKVYTDEKTAGKVSAEELVAATNAVKSAAVADAGTAADAKIAAATADLAKKSEIPDVSDLAKKSEIPSVADLAKKSDLDAKADDADVVKLAGAQTISGAKTFTSAVKIPLAPAANNDAASKQYVDDGNSSTLASAKVYVDNQVGYGQPYKLMQLTSGITLEDHHTYYVTITGNMTITLPKADDTHTTSRIISLYIECNGETAPTITVNKNGNTIVIQPTDYGGPSEEEDYFQPKPQGKTMINLIELKPNCYLAQQVYLKDWEF